MKYQLTVHGTPVAAGRPRFVRATGIAFDPPKSREYKQLIANAAVESKQAMLPAETPLRATFKIFMPMPISWTKKRKAEMLWKPVISKPDLDNIIKLLSDALNGIAYHDDSAIVCFGECFKVYSEKPRVEILISTLDENQ